MGMSECQEEESKRLEDKIDGDNRNGRTESWSTSSKHESEYGKARGTSSKHGSEYGKARGTLKQWEP